MTTPEKIAAAVAASVIVGSSDVERVEASVLAGATAFASYKLAQTRSPLGMLGAGLVLVVGAKATMDRMD